MGDFTEELVQNIASAEGQGKCVGRVQDSIEKATAPGSCCHLGTSSAAHEAPVVQGLADGNVAVIGHGGEKEILCFKEESKEEELGSTPLVGDRAHSMLLIHEPDLGGGVPAYGKGLRTR